MESIAWKVENRGHNQHNHYLAVGEQMAPFKGKNYLLRNPPPAKKN